jgi:small subunit ribosomal protein S14
MSKRQSVTSHELLRRAFKFVARNTTLPFRVRHQAQLQLNQFPAKSRPVAVKERCTETGRGRGVMTEFGLCRVSELRSSLMERPCPCERVLNGFSEQFRFRQRALAGELQGVHKASW